MTTLLLVLAAATAGQEKPAEGHRYEMVARPQPGQTLYAVTDLAGERVSLAVDVFAFRDMVKAMKAADAKGLEELESAGRLLPMKAETAMRYLSTPAEAVTGLPAYECRVLDGPHKDRKGYVLAPYARERVATPAKAKPARKKRR